MDVRDCNPLATAGGPVALVERAVGDFGSVLNAALVVVGDRLGRYRTLAERGPSTSGELAAASGTFERNVREWLSAQAAAGYVTYDGPVADDGPDPHRDDLVAFRGL